MIQSSVFAIISFSNFWNIFSTCVYSVSGGCVNGSSVWNNCCLFSKAVVILCLILCLSSLLILEERFAASLPGWSWSLWAHPTCSQGDMLRLSVIDWGEKHKQNNTTIQCSLIKYSSVASCCHDARPVQYSLMHCQRNQLSIFVWGREQNTDPLEPSRQRFSAYYSLQVMQLLCPPFLQLACLHTPTAGFHSFLSHSSSLCSSDAGSHDCWNISSLVKRHSQPLSACERDNGILSQLTPFYKHLLHFPWYLSLINSMNCHLCSWIALIFIQMSEATVATVAAT